MWQVVAVLCSIADDGRLTRCDSLVLPNNYSTAEECMAARDRQFTSVEQAAADFAAQVRLGNAVLTVRCDVPPARA